MRDNEDECSEEIRKIPLMQRRRLNPAGRLAVGLTADYLTKYGSEISKLVFASRCGEIPRCLKLICSIFGREDLSPAEFSASVHNANAGIATIVSGFSGEVTSLAGGEDTLLAALTEAYASLHEENSSKILVVCYEEDIANQQLMTFPQECDFKGPFALALLLGKNEGNRDLQTLELDADALSGISPYDFAKSILSC
jgi:3-oxoacyl-(acyl-carrier-protein) synthase